MPKHHVPVVLRSLLPYSGWVRACLVLWLMASAPLDAHSAPKSNPNGSPPAATDDPLTFTSETLRSTWALERSRGTDKRFRHAAGIQTFFSRHGADWEIRWDPAARRPHLVQGPGFDLSPGTLEHLAEEFLGEVADVLRIDPSDWSLDLEHSHRSGPSGTFTQLRFRRHHRGIPVDDAWLFARLRHHRVVQFGSHRVADLADVEVEPALTAEEVQVQALAHLNLLRRHEYGRHGQGDALPTTTPRLSIVPLAPSTDHPTYRHRLIWSLEIGPTTGGDVFRLRMDAQSGEILEVDDLHVRGQATGDVHTSWAPLPVPTPLPKLWVEDQGLRLTNDQGFFDGSGGTAAASLSGALIDVLDGCGPIALLGPDGDLDFSGSAGTDCAAPAQGGPGNTQAARDAYVHLTQGYGEVIERFPFQPWPQPLTAFTNQPEAGCEASWDASEHRFSFGRSDAQCNNIGENPSILRHELGHAVDSLLGGVAPDGASGEAQADVLAFLQTDDACIGRGLRPGIPCHNCDVQCSGVRDLDAFSGAGAAPIARPGTLTAPDGLACDRLGCPFPGDASEQGPLGFQAHCESQIASSAVLELDRRLQTIRGAANGRSAFEDLWFTSLPSFGAAYRRLPTAPLCTAHDSAVDGCGADNWYTVLLAADDDDGNLANGTPNGCLIWNAFESHGIACGDAPDCACKDGGGIADAGPDVTVCAGDSVRLGTLGDAVSTFRWLPGSADTPLLDVTPDHTTEYTLSVTNSCGTTYDTVTVDVASCGGFSEDFEDGAEGWTTSGDWHAVYDTPCASPSASDGSGALYFGQDATCTVDGLDTSPRDVISPPILLTPGMDSLNFDYFLGQAAASRRLGRVEVAVQEQGSTTWTPRWALELVALEAGGWQNSPPISLEAHQGKTVRLRFRFEAYALDGEGNPALGWLVDEVSITGDHRPGTSEPPVITLLEAPDGPVSECVCVRCRFLAVDGLGRNLSEILTWSSSLDGQLMSGSRSALILSPGDHLLTGTVTDYDGRTASLSIPIHIFDDPSPCSADGWPPAEPRLHCKDDEED